jgi:hypothetical protein
MGSDAFLAAHGTHRMGPHLLNKCENDSGANAITVDLDET